MSPGDGVAFEISAAELTGITVADVDRLKPNRIRMRVVSKGRFIYTFLYCSYLISILNEKSEQYQDFLFLISCNFLISRC